MASRFSAGATGHVAKSVNAQGRFAARLKSSVTVPSSLGAAIESERAAEYVVTPLVASVNSTDKHVGAGEGDEPLLLRASFEVDDAHGGVVVVEALHDRAGRHGRLLERLNVPVTRQAVARRVRGDAVGTGQVRRPRIVDPQRDGAGAADDLDAAIPGLDEQSRAPSTGSSRSIPSMPST